MLLWGVSNVMNMDIGAKDKIIEKLATKFSLVVFFHGNSPICQAFEPIIYHFARSYDFKLEAISVDGVESKFFPSVSGADLFESFPIESTPVVMVVSQDRTIVLELVRGYITLPELETCAQVAFIYLKNEGKWDEL